MKKIPTYLLPLIFCFQACQFKGLSEKENSADQTVSQTEKPENNVKIADNSMTSLDWAGVYTGKLPCADCDGIQTTLELRKDLTYTLQSKNIGKSDKLNTVKGTFSWTADGSAITLKDDSGKNPVLYQVGENKLIQLDMRGNKISGESAEDYKLTKIDSRLLDQHWKIIALNGKKLPAEPNPQKEAYLLLKAEGNRVGGSGGCNNLFGSYELKPGNGIRFSQLGATRMACPNMETETQLFQVLAAVDNYTLTADTLKLNKAKMAPLAVLVPGKAK